METDDNEQGCKDELITLKEIFFHSVLVAQQSIPQFKFYEDISVKTGTDRYVLLAQDKEAAIFHVHGNLTHLSVTAAGAVKHRRPGTKVDEYTARLQIDEDMNIQTIDHGFRALIELLKSNNKASENIAVSSGLVENRRAFKLEDITVKVSNFSNNVFYFNRKVATREKALMDDGQTPDFMLTLPPQGADYPSLRYPNGWNLNPLIPITDNEGLQLKPESIELPRRATVYFEVRQGCYNFEGSDGPVKQIVLVPSVIANKVHPPVAKELTIAQKAKRRRVSC